MLSVFQKFGGIRPMAAKIEVPPSTVKSWHAKRDIPEWRRATILARAKEHGIDLTEVELINIPADAPAEERAA
ncbi:carph-isopro domain-containing protein [Sphingobium amiense]|uniref:carph-isopro domain-containing protein n=1 Tax=Sphingobium amiense TaxID=135719 RepID=UPI000AB5759D|nr:hypothetical protein [Sphingobium amiense]